MKKERKAVFDKTNGRCAYCGCDLSGIKWQVDHIINKRNYAHYFANMPNRIPSFLKHLTPGDCEHIDNKLPACASCNNYKSTFDLELFRNELGCIVQRLNDYQPTYRLVKRFGLLQETPKPIVFYFETL